ncbi:MAG: hypothetical protein IRY86_10110 [Thermorudis peleae]|nr:hypothetical protein [Thermorudis peleae]
MAQTKTLTVESIEERTSQSGKPYWRVKVTGEKQAYFVWDVTLAEALLPGCTYQAVVNGSSDYPRIVDVTLVPDAAPAPDTAAPAASTPAAAADAREQRMLKMSALRAAADVLHGSQVSAGELLDYAELLLAWLEQ